MQQVKNASLRFAVVGCACWTLALCFGVKAQDAAPSSAQVLADRLMLAKDGTESYRAATDIFVRQREMEQALLKNLALLQKKPGENLRRYGGPFHQTVRVLADMRSQSAALALLSLIDFQLDPVTKPHGGFSAAISLYPVAQALADIGGPAVLQSIFARFAGRTDDRTLRSCAWVLSEMLGQYIAVAAVEQMAASEAKRLRPDLWVGSVHKANLERVKALLEQPAEILIDPSDKGQAAAAPPIAQAK